VATTVIFPQLELDIAGMSRCTRGVGKSHVCLSLALAGTHAGHTVLYRSAFDLAEDLSEAAATGTRKALIQKLTRTGLLVIEDLGMSKLPATAAEGLLEILSG
jgi:DNA replication protein DnaC